jgi:ribose transport system ATP-binding protein
MNQSKPLLELKGITKSFAAVKALDDVSFNVHSGKVHGLIGANGAGKSTIIKILAGAQSPDSGLIYMEGEEVHIADPRKSTALGLSFIHQEISLIENFNIIQNITLGLPKNSKLGIIDWKSMQQSVAEITQRIKLKRSLYTPVKELSIAEKWLVSIARALYQNAKMIAMDEPTASLSESEVETLFEVIRDITMNHNIAVIYVSHRLDEIIEICDEISVMRDGKKVHNSLTSLMSKSEIIDVIAGFHVSSIASESIVEPNKNSILELEHLNDGNKVKDVSFRLQESEILGLTGLVGAGRTEVAQIIFGLNKIHAGSMKFKDRNFAPKNTIEAIKQGIALIPEDRRHEGLVLNKNVNFNINLPNLKLARLAKWIPYLSLKKAAKISNDIINRLRIKTDTHTAPILSLSGGNQQKVVIGKWLQRNPELVIMDEPTQGVDVGARAEIYNIIKEMAKSGTSFLIISSDIEEVLGLCSRVVVMAEGAVTGELEGSRISKEEILKLCYTHNGFEQVS